MPGSNFDAVIPFPVGMLGIRTECDAVSAVEFLPADTPPRLANDTFTRDAIDELYRYFEDPAARFDVPVLFAGSEFQNRVWKHLQGIAPGQVERYQQVADTLRSSARAVGGACRRNPIAIIVPCHRVVAATGLGGFSGATEGAPLVIKRWLLDHESRALFS